MLDKLRCVLCWLELAQTKAEHSHVKQTKNKEIILITGKNINVNVARKGPSTE